jgi:hypothetical protein
MTRKGGLMRINQLRSAFPRHPRAINNTSFEIASLNLLHEIYFQLHCIDGRFS